MSRISDADLVAAIELVYRDRYQRFLLLALGMLGDVDRARARFESFEPGLAPGY